MPDIFVKIIRDLAERDPICWGVGWESEPHCFVCESDLEIREQNANQVGTKLIGFIHNHDCLWVRARRALNMDNPPARVLDEPIDVDSREARKAIGQ